MRNRPDPSLQAAQEVIGFLKKLPPKALLLIAVVGLIVVGAIVFISLSGPTSGPAVPPGTFLFCSWNVENFYDDQADPNNHDAHENWFAQIPEMFHRKADHLADALLLMNDGRGPDIMALYEVENENCLNTLMAALNERLESAGKGDAKYQQVLFKIDNTGRRFAPGMITRLPALGERTFKFAKHPNGRTLETHIKVNGHELVVLAAHWTSRVDSGRGKSNHEDHANAARRMSYAHDCYGRFRAILTENHDADVILCGDFNDEFTDPSVREGLHASDNLDEVRHAIEVPRPFDLFAHLPAPDPPGTIFGRGHWSIFDHICISRGLLDDKGWSCDPATAGIFAPRELRRAGKGEPFSFGKPGDSQFGYSDHFPVTTFLKVN